MFKLLCVLFGVGLAVTNGSRPLFYRRDYTYIAEFEAFYKFHWNPTIRSWMDAFKACDDEEAKLFYPKKDLEWTVVHNLMHVNETNTSEIILGFRDPYGFGDFVNVDGQHGNIRVTLLPTLNSTISGPKPRCVYMNITSGLNSTKDCSAPKTTIPFVCKRVDESSCPTIDKGYKYNKEVRKCYKVNNRRTTWQKAYQTCFLEGAMLLVVENESEANQIKSIFEPGQNYLAGFSKIDTEFFTVTGKIFEKVYKMEWKEPEPTPSPFYYNTYRNQYTFNNYYSKKDDNNNSDKVTNDNLDCGAVVSRSGTLFTKTVGCNETLPFVCEMTANVVG